MAPIGLCYLAGQLEQFGAVPLIVDLAALFPDPSPGFHDAVRYATSVLSALSPPPKLVGIGPLVTATLSSTHAIISACRDYIRCPIITGGPLFAVPGSRSVAEHFLGVDAYVAGDGETPTARIWESLDSRGSIVNGIPGVWTRGASEPIPFREANLDELPIPARHLLSSHLYRPSARRGSTGVSTTAAFLSRGCPYSCSFCSAPLSSGKSVRRFSPFRTVRELRACSGAGFDHIIFYDDCLFIRSPNLDARVLEFASSVRESGWLGTFQLELRCDAVSALGDRALTELAQAGCRQINMGIEKLRRVDCGTCENISPPKSPAKLVNAFRALECARLRPSFSEGQMRRSAMCERRFHLRSRCPWTSHISTRLRCIPEPPCSLRSLAIRDQMIGLIFA